METVPGEQRAAIELATDRSPPLELIATAAAGTEAVVKRELAALGYTAHTVTPGRLLFRGDPMAICRANLWLRTGERVLIHMGSFPATDFGALFDGTAALAWEKWVPKDAEFPVQGRSHRSQLSSVPACQRIVKRAVVKRLQEAHRVEHLPETGPRCSIEVSLRDDVAMLTLDTTGAGLHKRGYRRIVGEAQLRETLAAALVQLSFWRPGRVLADPFCGTGTIPIEAALIGRNIAPGLNREFVAQTWPALDDRHWQIAREEARDMARPPLSERLLGYDIDPDALSLARYHAEQAGVAVDIHWQERPFTELRAKAEYGCIITNPPYGERMGTDPEIEQLYKTFPLVLRRLLTWSHYILSARPDLEALVGQQADRRRKLYNGPIECTYYQFHGPRPPRPGALRLESGTATRDEQHESSIDHAQPAPSSAEPASTQKSPLRERAIGPAFGGLLQESKRQAEEFGNRLRKRARHLRRWPTRRGITCYRLYERDVPEVPLVVDRYEDALHIAEFARPHERSPAQHADWLDLMTRTASDVLDVPLKRIFVKHRDRQRGTAQYQRIDERHAEFVVQEGGLKFLVNLSDYVDTGLFLDHRITRQMVRDAAAEKRFLNLFGYTASFTAYAAAGGATTTTTVDKSATYIDWARKNLELNGFVARQHHLVRSGIQAFVAGLSPGAQWDLVVVDPPTFSNTKGIEDPWDVQRDHAQLLRRLAAHITTNGVVYFSSNFRRFKLDEAALSDYAIRDITRQTIPEDFRNQRIHKCWKLVRR
ncbi:MAG TPA: bifunctional 23S rRNA (guanine(2069)-N(7))-methyltransferase RlmK/23S rRNA (guanine(2445)-N(2))-methyltransferase RlmL [Lacipirellulaceae bacterium]|nr:bifunctional 23S rRNA (guanine(2069)-N(7))-methyltransferase RlmK/23S rRNA (guanine(2445)-N(2))-methyltransferase RlmL [Lacipirellulaceae bacterium]